MNIVFALLSKRTFSAILEDVNSKKFSLAPLASVGLPLLLCRQYSELSAYTMYNITGILGELSFYTQPKYFGASISVLLHDMQWSMMLFQP